MEHGGGDGGALLDSGGAVWWRFSEGPLSMIQWLCECDSEKSPYTYL